jgi:hypothetical protein
MLRSRRAKWFGSIGAGVLVWFLWDFPQWLDSVVNLASREDAPGYIKAEAAFVRVVTGSMGPFGAVLFPVALMLIAGFVALVGYHSFIDWFWPTEPPPTSDDWHRMEERFRHVDDELQGFWSLYGTGLIQWSVHPGDTSRRDSRRQADHRDRSRERFETEAGHAGAMLRRLNYIAPGFPPPYETDDFGYWMSALSALVPLESGMTGSGRDEIGTSASGHIDNVVHASRLLCAKVARITAKP